MENRTMLPLLKPSAKYMGFNVLLSVNINKLLIIPRSTEFPEFKDVYISRAM